MLKPRGFCIIVVQLLLAAGMDADWSVQRTPFSFNLGNRPYLQMTPPSFDPLHSDPGDTGQWPSDLYNDTKSNQKSAVNGSVGLWFTEPLMPSMLKMGNQQHMTLSEVDTKHSHQTIVILEEDPAVIESATYLFERHPTTSTLLRYQRGVLHVLKGSQVLSTRYHDVILVGHGSNGANGAAQLAGYGPEELAKFVVKIQSIFGHLGTVSLVSCNIGNELHFVLQLLQVLRSLSVETKLHLHNSFLSVNSDGQIMTRTGGVWRSHDNSKRVIAELDQRGNLITRSELGCAGPVFPSYKGNVLYLQTLEWPSHPQMFVPMELRKKYPSIDCLEGLTWSLFFEENDRRRAPDYVPDLDQRHLKAIWLTEPGPDENKIIYKHIVNIQDLLVEIRYNAREEVTSDLYYVLNDCIYRVYSRNLSVSLVGKFMSGDNKAEIENFRLTFNEDQRETSLQELRQGLKDTKFNDFCRQTFQYQQCNYNCERWGRYFMTAVFSASVRNFRTFSLFLMSVIGCEVGRLRGNESPLCTAFVGADHPMVTDQPWPDRLKRGFYGCTVDNYDMAPQNKQLWLDQVVAKENDLYIKAKQMMNTVDHDEQTELDIFGKVKVMNKYVFSSFMESFRGTPEGKKLKRGCNLNFHENYNQ
ncbi:uncharacterized protein LOC109136982 [Larimichthys crocea]|uniref:uncharacterized protein LOC109136982 n=1 Tax=Larimichthys crocea TaxID=215358 RepID=UPI000900BB05|nr:uncharacterized protein LOC109136982 [Larimichthys crocea]XP_027142752.1 uncharacterized protein LOC109136982 [Larimichthys crocea]